LNSFDSYYSAGTTCTSVVSYDSTGNVVSAGSASKTKIVWTCQMTKLRTAAQLA